MLIFRGANLYAVVVECTLHGRTLRHYAHEDDLTLVYEFIPQRKYAKIVQISVNQRHLDTHNSANFEDTDFVLVSNSR